MAWSGYRGSYVDDLLKTKKKSYNGDSYVVDL